MEIPKKGLSEKEIFATLEDFRKNDLKWQEGRAFGYVFDPGRDVLAVGKKAYNLLSQQAVGF
jgi:sphinganine-1-phosphate aldolase